MFKRHFEKSFLQPEYGRQGEHKDERVQDEEAPDRAVEVRHSGPNTLGKVLFVICKKVGMYNPVCRYSQ